MLSLMPSALIAGAFCKSLILILNFVENLSIKLLKINAFEVESINLTFLSEKIFNINVFWVKCINLNLFSEKKQIKVNTLALIVNNFLKTNIRGCF